MTSSRGARTIGLLSDTHGLLRPAVHSALAGVELIIHAGDVGDPGIIHELAAIAPTRAVFGNTDPPGMPGLERELAITVAGITIHVSHGHELGVPTPESLLGAYIQDVLVYGHTHRPLVRRVGERLVVNPGAAGPPRFGLRPSVARLTIQGGSVDASIVFLDQ